MTFDDFSGLSVNSLKCVLKLSMSTIMSLCFIPTVLQ